MSWSTYIKHFVISATTALSPANSNKAGPGDIGDVAGAISNFVADIGVSESVKRQLIGIERIINDKLFDLGPFLARQTLKILSRETIQTIGDCSIYDVFPDENSLQLSGALVFVKYFRDQAGVVRDPSVELVGFGKDMDSTWRNSQKMPRMTATGQGAFQKKDSYMLWYQFKDGRIESGKIPYPFYLSVVK